ncbi:MAG: hypothetical protein LUD69_07130 [Oscillospiraceae bacterium]|nr:hypothetical protein [Oscillospiraceae bacterium]
MELSEIIQIIIAILLFAATILVVNQVMKWITKTSPKQDGFYKRVKERFHRREK